MFRCSDKYLLHFPLHLAYGLEHFEPIQYIGNPNHMSSFIKRNINKSVIDLNEFPTSFESTKIISQKDSYSFQKIELIQTRKCLC